MRIGPRNIFRKLFPGAVWEVDDPKGLYLTFDMLHPFWCE